MSYEPRCPNCGERLPKKGAKCRKCGRKVVRFRLVRDAARDERRRTKARMRVLPHYL